MTITVPSNFNLPGIRTYAGRAPIQADDWGALAESLHYLYEKRGIYLGGRVFEGGISADSTAEFYVGGVPTRVLTGGWDVVFAVHGEHYTASLDLENLDTSTTVSSLSITAGSSKVWSTDTDTLTDAEIRDDGTTGGTLTLLHGAVDINVDEGNSGVIYHIACYATRNISGSDINTTP